MIDIIYEEYYKKRVESSLNGVYQSGRQEGWNDIINIVYELDSKDEIITIEKIIKELEQVVKIRNQV